MMGRKLLPKRSEIAQAYKWHIEDIYADDRLWKEDFEALSQAYHAIEDYEGKLGESGDMLYAYLKFKDALLIKMERLYVYANQKSHEDLAEGKYQDLAAQIGLLATQISSALSFEGPELLALGSERIEALINSTPGLAVYRHYLEDILRQKAHTLSKDMEALLSDAGDFAQTPEHLFSMFNNADLKFPVIKDENGDEVEITHGRYVSLMESKDRNVRKAAFEGLYHTYEAYRNTLAAVYGANIKKELFFAKARHYDSTLAMHLDANAVDLAVYHNLIETVHEYLPAMHAYVSLRKKLLGLDEIHMYDLYTPIVADMDMHFTFEEAKEAVLEGLRPLGEAYTALLREGFDGGWIDVYENQGKRSGAYSWGAYGVHPFVLMNFQGNLDNVFTLAHEMGHSLHTYYSNENQAYVNSSYCIFVAEVASTCNEILLMNNMLNKTADKSEKAYILNHYLETFKGTLFRQTMFAEFEKITHEMAARGETLTADILCNLYHELNVRYFGPEMVVDKEIDMEWARIPHFYTPFYVYQYATGISAASAFAKRILEEGERAVERYKQFLSGGCSKYPIDLLADAGVDMRTKEPVRNALETFAEVLGKTKALLD